jgi:multidrug efflux pump subunit AcrA (membrane-fusion protein)
MTKWILLCVVMMLMVMPVACASPQAAKTMPVPPVSAPAPNATLPGPPQIGMPSPPQTATPIPIVTASGRLSLVQDIKLTFGTSGQVAQVNVSELDKVTKGQVLAKLDTTSLEQAVKATELTLKLAESDRELAKNGIKSAEADYETMQENVKAASIDLEQAQDSLREITYPYTYRTVYIDVPTALGFINDAENEIIKATAALNTGQPSEASHQLQRALDSLTKSRDLLSRRGYGKDVFAIQHLSMEKFWTLRAAELQVERSQVAVENAKNTANKTAMAVENAKTAFDKAQIAVDKASNSLDTARYQLQKAIITAPFDGVIAAVNIEELDLLSSVNYATTTAIEIIDPNRMELYVEVNELDIPNVKLGQEVAISVNALPGTRFDGTVTSIDTLPMVESSLVSYGVQVVFDVPQDSALKAGMTATAEFVADKW